MKRLVALALCFAMVLSFAACGKKNEGNNEGNNEAGTPAQTVLKVFEEKVGSASDFENLAFDIIEGADLPFMPATMPVEEGYLNGFKSEIKGFKAGQMFGPMIGSIPFIGYIFELADGTTADAFTATLKSEADLRWNVCTSADEMAVKVVGKTVCFVMAPNQFEEN